MTLVFGQIFVRDLEKDEIWRGVTVVLGREGYQAFDGNRVPPGYPAQTREFVRIAVSEPDPLQTRAILCDDWERVFFRALALSELWPQTPIVAIARPPLENTRVKVYQAGQVALKVGEDADEELFYRPPCASAAEVNAFIASWRPSAKGISCLVLGLSSIRRDCTYLEAVSGAWPYPLEERVFISRRSRLYLES